MIKLRRGLWWLLAWLCLGLATLGVVVPGLPTTPFVLLAAFAATRGSPRLHAWLLAHRIFGPTLRNWEQGRAIGRRAKILSLVMMALSWLLLAWQVGEAWVLLVTGLLFTATAAFICTRPAPPRAR